MGRFERRIALVTGGSGGIGSAICRRLAAEDASVAVAYGTGAEAAQALCAEIAAAGGRAQAFGADMAEPTGPAQLVAAVERSLGAIDLLVANHGLGRRARYEDLAAEDFDRTIAINLRAPFLLAQQVLPGMRERRFGRVLFISSTAAFRGGALAPDYAASKAGLHGLAHFLASRTAAEGVTVNVLAPGFVETAMLPDEPAKLAANVPLGRVGRPEEVAELACAMLENSYITNQTFGIDGGMHPR